MGGKAVDYVRRTDDGKWVFRFNYLDRSKINPKNGKPGKFYSGTYTTQTSGSRKTAEKEAGIAFEDWKRGVKSGEILTKQEEKERQEQEFYQAELKKKQYEEIPTVTETIDWYIWARRVEVKPGTIENWRHQFNQFSADFGQMKITEITPEMLNKHMKNRYNSGIKYSSFSTYYDTLKCFFNYLAENKRISESPMRDMKKPKKPKAKQAESTNLALTFDEYKRFEEGLKNEPPMHQAMMKLMACTGLRRGEIAPLEWSDFDFENKMLHVTKNAQNAKDEGGWYITTPKSGLSRDIPLPGPIVTVMKEWKITQATNNLLKKGITQNKYCFEGRDGGYFNPTAISNYFKTFSKRYGLPGFHPHKLRHTFGSYFTISQSGDIVTLQHILGHAELSTTQKYAHTNEDAKRWAMNNFGDFMEKIESKAMKSESAASG